MVVFFPFILLNVQILNFLTGTLCILSRTSAAMFGIFPEPCSSGFWATNPKASFAIEKERKIILEKWLGVAEAANFNVQKHQTLSNVGSGRRFGNVLEFCSSFQCVLKGTTCSITFIGSMLLHALIAPLVIFPDSLQPQWAAPGFTRAVPSKVGKTAPQQPQDTTAIWIKSNLLCSAFSSVVSGSNWLLDVRMFGFLHPCILASHSAPFVPAEGPTFSNAFGHACFQHNSSFQQIIDNAAKCEYQAFIGLKKSQSPILDKLSQDWRTHRPRKEIAITRSMVKKGLKHTAPKRQSKSGSQPFAGIANSGKKRKAERTWRQHGKQHVLTNGMYLLWGQKGNKILEPGLIELILHSIEATRGKKEKHAQKHWGTPKFLGQAGRSIFFCVSTFWTAQWLQNERNTHKNRSKHWKIFFLDKPWMQYG